MATSLYFMRHGKTTLNLKRCWSGQADCNILKDSKRDIKENFKKYSNIQFDVFYCSPLKRTQQTLNVLFPGQTPIVDRRIIERNFGDWEGKPYEIINEAIREQYIQWKVQPPNGETSEQVKARVKSFVSDLFKRYNHNEKILIISHATVMRMVRDLYLPEKKKEKIDNSQVFIVTNENFENYKKSNSKF